VKVGPYPCIIADKDVSATTIACVTTEAFDPNRRVNQVVDVFVKEVGHAKCKKNL